MKSCSFLIFIFLIAGIISSCNLEKRLYRPGFYWEKKQDQVQPVKKSSADLSTQPVPGFHAKEDRKEIATVSYSDKEDSLPSNAQKKKRVRENNRENKNKLSEKSETKTSQQPDPNDSKEKVKRDYHFWLSIFFAFFALLLLGIIPYVLSNFNGSDIRTATIGLFIASLISGVAAFFVSKKGKEKMMENNTGTITKEDLPNDAYALSKAVLIFLGVIVLVVIAIIGLFLIAFL